VNFLSRGSQSGEIGGIKFLLDVEAFDYSYTGKESVGFRIAFSDTRDKPLVKQEGFLIPPGTHWAKRQN
jgi:hypothetical protein